MRQFAGHSGTEFADVRLEGGPIQTTLVSGGLTNRAIARRLSVAEKTVEMHLSNDFGKLAVASPRQRTLGDPRPAARLDR